MKRRLFRWNAYLVLLVTGCILLFVVYLPKHDLPNMYPVAGTVTFGSQPLSRGHIRLEPLEGVRNRHTVTQALIVDGEFHAEVIGGPHRIYVRDRGGMFRMEYRTEKVLPRIDELAAAEIVPLNLDVPASHE